ncbi:SCN10A [Symbiodinium sp. CCMP2456]|nr:SCN10A [Symbiodinium sp. CCMP2456]
MSIAEKHDHDEQNGDEGPSAPEGLFITALQQVKSSQAELIDQLVVLERSHFQDLEVHLMLRKQLETEVERLTREIDARFQAKTTAARKKKMKSSRKPKQGMYEDEPAEEPAEEPAAKPEEAVEHAVTTNAKSRFTHLVKADAHVDGISDDFNINKRLEHARAKLESSRNNSAMRRVEQLLKMAMGRDEDSEDLSFQRAMKLERFRASSRCFSDLHKFCNLYNLAQQNESIGKCGSEVRSRREAWRELREDSADPSETARQWIISLRRKQWSVSPAEISSSKILVQRSRTTISAKTLVPSSRTRIWVQSLVP